MTFLIFVSFCNEYFERFLLVNTWICFLMAEVMHRDLKKWNCMVACHSRKKWWLRENRKIFFLTIGLFAYAYGCIFVMAELKHTDSFPFFYQGMISKFINVENKNIFLTVGIPYLLLLLSCSIQNVMLLKWNIGIAYLCGMLPFMLNSFGNYLIDAGNGKLQYFLRDFFYAQEIKGTCQYLFLLALFLLVLICIMLGNKMIKKRDLI